MSREQVWGNLLSVLPNTTSGKLICELRDSDDNVVWDSEAVLWMDILRSVGPDIQIEAGKEPGSMWFTPREGYIGVRYFPPIIGGVVTSQNIVVTARRIRVPR